MTLEFNFMPIAISNGLCLIYGPHPLGPGPIEFEGFYYWGA